MARTSIANPTLRALKPLAYGTDKPIQTYHHPLKKVTEKGLVSIGSALGKEVNNRLPRRIPTQGYRLNGSVIHNERMLATRSLWNAIGHEGVIALVERISDTEAIEMTEHYGAHNYHPMPVNIVRGNGAWVEDGSGKKYIDCVGAYSAVAHGHLNEAVVTALKAQLDKIAVTSRAFYTTEVALFLKGLAEYTELEMVCPMNTGAEAVETCIKLARKWAYTVKGVPEDQAEIIVCNDNFHGRTTTIVGFSTESNYKRGFGPFTPGFRAIPFGNLEALEKAITPNTAAFLAEPIQAEGGIIVPPPGYLAAVRRLCNENQVLLIWDEVQTGFCRTGKKFAWMYEDSKPDLLAVGKPLGGGILPVSAAVGSKAVISVFNPGDHGSTFGGNPLASVVALTALAEMENGDFAGRATVLGDKFQAALRALPYSQIVDVRGKGLLIGLEFDSKVDTHKLTERFIANGILTKETRNHTYRFAPPLVVEEDLIDEIMNRVETSLKETL